MDDEDVAGALVGGWHLDVASLAYLPVGFGSHHWQVSASGAEWFVSVDAVGGNSSDAGPTIDRHSRLDDALSAVASVVQSGVDFPVAPLPTLSGQLLQRFAGRYALAVYPFVQGRRRTFFEPLSLTESGVIVELLAELHAVPPARCPTARTDDFVLQDEGVLRDTLKALDEPWCSGPYGESARHLLRTGIDRIENLLRHRQALVRSALRSATVITHGEIHPGNWIEGSDGWRLVDWDTLLRAPRERDIWMLDGGTGEGAAAYEATTGTRLQHDLFSLYGLTWTLNDLAAYAAQFRQPHEDTQDVRTAWTALQSSLDG